MGFTVAEYLHLKHSAPELILRMGVPAKKVVTRPDAPVRLELWGDASETCLLGQATIFEAFASHAACWRHIFGAAEAPVARDEAEEMARRREMPSTHHGSLYVVFETWTEKNQLSRVEEVLRPKPSKSQASGLVRFQVQSAKTQALEARCSTRVVLLVSEICQPFETEEDEGEGQSFTTRLSLKIQELNNEIERHQKTKDQIDAAKKKAAANEELERMKNDNDLGTLQGERDRLLQQRDTVCMRVLSIVSALLRWSNSDLRKDPALMGTLNQILLPMVSLPALSKEVEVSVVYAICLFSVRDGDVAKSHWSLMLTLLRALQEVEQVDTASCPPGSAALANLQCDRARAAVAARALADCARIHGGLLDRDEVLSAASALAAVPFSSRQADCAVQVSFELFSLHAKQPQLPAPALQLLSSTCWRRAQRRPLSAAEAAVAAPQLALQMARRLGAAAESLVRMAVDQSLPAATSWLALCRSTASLLEELGQATLPHAAQLLREDSERSGPAADGGLGVLDSTLFTKLILVSNDADGGLAQSLLVLLGHLQPTGAEARHRLGRLVSAAVDAWRRFYVVPGTPREVWVTLLEALIACGSWGHQLALVALPSWLGLSLGFGVSKPLRFASRQIHRDLVQALVESSQWQPTEEALHALSALAKEIMVMAPAHPIAGRVLELLRLLAGDQSPLLRPGCHRQLISIFVQCASVFGPLCTLDEATFSKIFTLARASLRIVEEVKDGPDAAYPFRANQDHNGAVCLMSLGPHSDVTRSLLIQSPQQRNQFRVESNESAT
eukprot:g23093.t1